MIGDTFLNRKVIITTPTWNLSGVNTFSVNLARGLRRHGVETKILLTRTDRYPDYHTDMPSPSDIRLDILPVEVKKKYWEEHWQAIIDYLEGEAPCIYIPNYDFEHSCVSPRLSDRIGIVGIVHSDDPDHYEHVRRLGIYWNSIVAVSKDIGDTVSKFNHGFSERLSVIPNGVYVPDDFIQRQKRPESKIRLVYSGRLVQYQKRILDLSKIIELLFKRQIPFELTIIGSGPEEQKLHDMMKEFVNLKMVHFLGTVSNDVIYDLLAQNDVFLLTSEFEGKPMSLLEAMGQGCVPVVTDIRSGIPELVQDGFNGYKVPVGDIELFADRIATIQQDQRLFQKMSNESYNKVKYSGHTIEYMTQQYVDLFNNIAQELKEGRFKRPHGGINPPPFMQGKSKALLRRIQHFFQRVRKC